jgi:HEAT repeat protein
MRQLDAEFHADAIKLADYKHKKRVVKLQVERLQDPSPKVRTHAAQKIKSFGSNSEELSAMAAQALPEALANAESPSVRVIAANALASVSVTPSCDALPVLRDTLKEDTNADVRKAAAEALGNLAAVRTQDELALVDALTTDTHPGVRVAACKAIAKRATVQKHARGILEEAQIMDEDPDVREVAEHALFELQRIARCGPSVNRAMRKQQSVVTGTSLLTTTPRSCRRPRSLPIISRRSMKDLGDW